MKIFPYSIGGFKTRGPLAMAETFSNESSFIRPQNIS